MIQQRLSHQCGLERVGLVSPEVDRGFLQMARLSVVFKVCGVGGEEEGGPHSSAGGLPMVPIRRAGQKLQVCPSESHQQM